MDSELQADPKYAMLPSRRMPQLTEPARYGALTRHAYRSYAYLYDRRHSTSFRNGHGERTAGERGFRMAAVNYFGYIQGRCRHGPLTPDLEALPGNRYYIVVLTIPVQTPFKLTNVVPVIRHQLSTSG